MFVWCVRFSGGVNVKHACTYAVLLRQVGAGVRVGGELIVDPSDSRLSSGVWTCNRVQSEILPHVHAAQRYALKKMLAREKAARIREEREKGVVHEFALGCVCLCVCVCVCVFLC